jgi:photosystem II stability/assembly factor-like uncharacterized protein
VKRLLFGSLIVLPLFGCPARALDVPLDGGNNNNSDGGFSSSGGPGSSASDMSPFAACTSLVPAQPASWQTASIPMEDNTAQYPPYRVRGDGSGAVVVGTYEGLWTTTDDGQTFTMFDVEFDSEHSFAEIAYGAGRFVALPYNIFEVVDQSYTSIDHGQSWSKFAKSDKLGLAQGLVVDGSSLYVADIENFDPDVPAGAFVSNDEGHTWRNLEMALPAGFAVVEGLNSTNTNNSVFVTDGTLFIGGADPDGDPMLVRSHDGGQTFASWTYAGSRQGCGIASLWAHDASVVLLLDCSIEFDINSVAAVLYSTDGGVTFAESTTPMLPVVGTDDGLVWYWREVNGNARGDIVAVGDNGVALYSNDGGASFTPLTAPTQDLDMISSVWLSVCGAVYMIAPNTGTFYAGH